MKKFIFLGGFLILQLIKLHIIKFSVLFVALSGPIFLFNNCGEGFESSSFSSYELDGLHLIYSGNDGVQKAQPMSYEVVDNHVVIDGDIVVGESGDIFVENQLILNSVQASLVGDRRQADLQKVSSKLGLAKTQFPLFRLWDNGEVPYTFSMEISDSELNYVEGVIEGLNEKFVDNNIRLRFVEKQSADSAYVIFNKNESNRCMSGLGYNGGAVSVELGRDCFEDHIIKHQLMHTLGFLHQHNRVDRDDFITINSNNIRADKLEIYKPWKSNIGLFKYDYESIMHISSSKYSLNDDMTMESKDGSEINENLQLSDLDLKSLKLIYGTPRMSVNYNPLNLNDKVFVKAKKIARDIDEVEDEKQRVERDQRLAERRKKIDDERARIAAEKEKERLAKIAAEKERKRLAALAAAEKERKRLAALAAAEKERKRLAALAAEKERKRLAALAAEKERKRLAALAAEKERKRLAALAAEKERKRLAALAAEKERKRLAALAAEKERKRLAALAAEKERKRLAALAAEKERKRLAALAAEKERKRLAALAAEKERKRLAALAAEKERKKLAALAAEKERKRLAALAAEKERKRLAALAAEKERKRLAALAAEKERKRLAALAAEKERKRLAALAAEKERKRLAALAAEKERKRLAALAAEKERKRLAALAAEKERKRLAALAAEKERKRLAALAAEKERKRLAALAAEKERKRLAALAAEKERKRLAALAAEKERKRLAALAAEKERKKLAALAAEKERKRLAALAAEKERLRLAKLAAEEALKKLAPSATKPWRYLNAAQGTRVQARHEADAVEFQGKIYVFGGRSTRYTSVYNPATNTWTNKSRAPIELNHFQAVEWGNKIWIIGAMTGRYPRETSVPDIYTYTPSTDKWKSVGKIPVSRRRGSASVVVYNDIMYIVAGNTRGHSGGAVNWFDSYNPATGEWKILGNAPSARDHTQAGIAGGHLIVSGGRKSTYPDTWANLVKETDAYNFKTGRWSSVDQIPTGRAGNMTVSVGNEVIFIGGETKGNKNAHKEVEAYNVVTKAWRTLKPLLSGRHGGGAAVVGGNIHVITGNTTRGGGRETTSHEILPLGK